MLNRTKKAVRVRLICSIGACKFLLIVGRAGRYMSVDSGTKAESNASKAIRPREPRYFWCGGWVGCVGVGWVGRSA